MINAIIIDDETNCIDALQEDIKMFCPEVTVIDACHSGKEGILSIQRNKPDLVLLDVEMPWMNGFEMLEILDKEINFRIIFTTAYDQFAVKAFRVSAVDYLLKPVDSSDLIAAIAKVKNGIKEKEDHTNINNLLNNSKVSIEKQRIAVPGRDGYDLIPLSDIIYCKANGSYTDIVLVNNKTLILSRKLGETESILPPELFERIHHSVIVNTQYIDKFKKTNGWSIVMNNGEELAVAKSKREQLLQRLGIR